MIRTKLIGILFACQFSLAVAALGSEGARSLNCVRDNPIVGYFDSEPLTVTRGTATADVRTVINVNQKQISRLLFLGPSFADDTPSSYIFVKGQPLKQRYVTDEKILYTADQVVVGDEVFDVTLALDRVRTSKPTPPSSDHGTPIFGVATWHGFFEKTVSNAEGEIIGVATISLSCREVPEWPRTIGQ